MADSGNGSGRSVAIIGSGIVGVSTAVWLAREGHEVILINRGSPEDAASYGNAGNLVPSSVVPLTVPGLPGKAPKMLLDPDSPLFLRWSYLPKLAPWLVKYLSHCKATETARIAQALTPLLHDCVEQHQALAKGTPAERWLTSSDYIFLYPDRAAFEGDAFTWSLREKMGVRWDILEGEALAEHDPVIAARPGFGVRMRNHGFVSDPGAYVKDLLEHARELGARVLQASAYGFAYDGTKLRAVETDAGPVPCAVAVIAAGAWSSELTSKLGLKPPLETERGYHIELVEPSVVPRQPVMVTAGKFVATPMAGRLRCAGIVEFGGLHAPASKAPTELLLKRILEVMPDLRWKDMRAWMGHRPAPADSIPLIGKLPGPRELYVGFGHHHVGLSSGPKTGRIIADLVVGRRPNIDLSPFRPERFPLAGVRTS